MRSIRSVCTKNWKIRFTENAVKIIHGGMPSSGSGTQTSSSHHGFHFCRTAVDRLNRWLLWCAWCAAQRMRTRCAARCSV